MISFLITVCNEHEELSKLLLNLKDVITPSDEVVILVDDTKTTAEVTGVLSSYQKELPLRTVLHSFAGDFALFKNFGNSQCTQPWILQLDADELLSDSLKLHVRDILTYNNDLVDLLYIPRVNTVKDITLDHVNKWGWRITMLEGFFTSEVVDVKSAFYKLLTEYNLIKHNTQSQSDKFSFYLPIINFPDIQGRLYKNNSSIKWKGKVHERIEGALRYSILPDDMHLLHFKTIQKQEQQNNLYQQI